MSNPQEAVQIVRAVAAVKRIPTELEDWTFFSPNDIWHYMGVSDERLCELCEINDGLDLAGDMLRGKFPFLEIVDKGVIYPHVHPNCRCVLMRMAAPMEILQELGY